ncbi:MAG TPA: hypothetical protein VFP20_04320 [Bacteroidales bacterium]|nr:hypothetical protein [Bacteroidales bacterium]
MKKTRRRLCRARSCYMVPVMVLGLFAVSGLVYFLWNWVMPSVSTLTAITYWQAMGLFVLCRILFGGFRFGFRKHRDSVQRHFSAHAPFKDKFMEMTEEERQQFKNQWKQRCCK